MSRLAPIRRGVSKLWRGFDGLAGDTLWSGAHDAIALVTAFLSFALITRVLETDRYGAYVGIYGLLGAVGAFSYSGVGLALLQRLVGERDDPDRALRSFLSLALLGGVGLGAIAVGASLFFNRLLSVSEVLTIVAAELLGTATVFVSSILIQASAGFAAAIRVRLGLVVTRLILVLGLQLTGHLSILNLGIGALAVFSAYSAFLLLVHLPKHGYRVSLGRPSRTAVKASWLFSVPMGAGKIQTDGDKFLLVAFGFGAEAGLYGAAYRILLLGITPLMALDTAAFQRFLPRSEGVKGVHWRRSTRLGALMATASVLVAIGLYVVARPLLNFIVEDEYREAIDIVPWLLPLVPLISTSGTPLNGLLGLGRSTQRMYVYLVAAVVSVVAYLLLIPMFDWRGAVIATYISEVFLAVAGWWSLWYYQRKADQAIEHDPVMTPA